MNRSWTLTEGDWATCPFCGGSNALRMTGVDTFINTDRVWVECTRCDASLMQWAIGNGSAPTWEKTVEVLRQRWGNRL